MQIKFLTGTISLILNEGVFASIEDHGVNSFVTTLLLKSVPLFAANFLIITGMYVLNDFFDTDLDKSSGKKRPISSGQVTKVQALIFVIVTNAVGVILAVITFNLPTLIIALIIIGMGLMYSAPKICVKERFVLKTASIAATNMFCLLLGSSYAFTTSSDALDNPILICSYATLMSGSIIFITSLLNDLGDVEEDYSSSRR